MADLRSRLPRAAGGVVIRDGEALLLLKRRPMEVRLPKGRIEPGETATEAAVREVAEETGYAGRVVADLGTRRVQIRRGATAVTREETFFLMRLASPRPVPRAPAEVAKFLAVWMPVGEAERALTFDSEREVFRAAQEALAEAAPLAPPVVRRLSETAPVRCPCGDAYRILTAADSPGASVHIVRIDADARPHSHRILTEYYVVLEGEGHVELDSAREPVSPGTVVMIPPGVRHRAVGPLKILNLVVPAFRPDDEVV